jgi:hypothetical protein
MISRKFRSNTAGWHLLYIHQFDEKSISGEIRPGERKVLAKPYIPANCNQRVDFLAAQVSMRRGLLEDGGFQHGLSKQATTIAGRGCRVAKLPGKMWQRELQYPGKRWRQGALTLRNNMPLLLAGLNEARKGETDMERQ